MVFTPSVTCRVDHRHVVHANELAFSGFVHSCDDDWGWECSVRADDDNRVGVNLGEAVKVADGSDDANHVTLVDGVSEVLVSGPEDSESDTAVVDGERDVAGGGKRLCIHTEDGALEFAHYVQRVGNKACI